MLVSKVLVLFGVWVLTTSAERNEGLAVREEVEKIFKSVQEFMYGNNAEVKRNFKPAPVQNRGNNEGDFQVKDSTVIKKISTDPEVLPRTISENRAFVKPMTKFPVGIILSDSLYPLVVGKDVDSGVPFVMNFNKEDALVVAKTGHGEDYKLVIPFPVMMEESPGEYLPLVDDRVENSETHGSQRDPRTNQGFSNYNEGEPFSPENQEIKSPKVLKKYIPNYQSHSSDEVTLEKPYYNKYLQKTPQKYIAKQINRSVGKRYPINGNHNTYPEEGKHYKVRMYNQEYHSFPKEHSSQLFSGTVYNRYLPNVQKTHAPNLYRNSHSEQYQLENKTQSRPMYNQDDPTIGNYQREQPIPKPYSPKKYIVPYGKGEEVLKSSPYTRNTTQDDVHQEKFHTEIPEYEDRGIEFTEQDYMDSIRDSPGSHTSSGGVDHVTYHVDDYLGKIYEEMYYKLPGIPEVNTREHMNTEYHMAEDLQNKGDGHSNSAPGVVSQRLENENQDSTISSDLKVGPVTFTEVMNKEEKTAYR